MWNTGRAKQITRSFLCIKSPGKVGIELFYNLFKEKLVDYRAGAGPGIMTSWSRVKIEHGSTPQHYSGENDGGTPYKESNT